jgi:asparagine synthase (glutamine-hydrolysing)
MCGIAGFTNFGNAIGNINEIIEDMTNTLKHRGPDDSGTYITCNVALGQTRLSVIDLNFGHQPMISEDGRYVIVYNGEVYNYKEIRKTMEEKGYKFRTQSDTEVILKAYIEYGEECLQLFNGMFALVIYDTDRKNLFIARDRLGVKPLYYTVQNKNIIFASEIKAILKYPNIPRNPNLNGISSYLGYRYVVGNETLFENIYVLEAGHYMICNEYGINKVKYWDIPIIEEEEDLGEEYYKVKVKELLSESVKYRMISDVPIGAYLSGGLDSSIVVAIMAKLSDKPIKTYTIGFREEGYNEFDYSRLMANIYNTNHHEILMNSDDYIELIPEMIKYKDLPLSVANEIPLYVMSKELKKDITVVLSGEGADELFGGYGRIFRSAEEYDLLQFIENEQDFIPADFKTIYLNNINKRYGKISFKNRVEHFLDNYNWLSISERETLFTEDVRGYLSSKKKAEDIFYENFENLKHLSGPKQYMWIFEKLHLQGLLYRVDTTTMATAVEARVPFVDYKLVEFMQTVPLKYKIRWKSENHKKVSSIYTGDQISEKYDITKYILRKAFEKEIPDEILYRKKVGFPVPIHEWLGGKHNQRLKDILLNDKARNRNIIDIKKLETLINNKENFKSHKFGLKMWMLMNLELWFNEYLD